MAELIGKSQLQNVRVFLTHLSTPLLEHGTGSRAGAGTPGGRIRTRAANPPTRYDTMTLRGPGGYVHCSRHTTPWRSCRHRPQGSAPLDENDDAVEHLGVGDFDVRADSLGVTTDN